MRTLAIFFAALCLSLVVGCARTIAIQPNTTQVSLILNQEEMRDAIHHAMLPHAWTGQDIAPNVVRAKFLKGTHELTVDITYEPSQFVITYVSSVNLLDDGQGNIHRAYAKWVNTLSRDIYYALEQANGIKRAQMRNAN